MIEKQLLCQMFLRVLQLLVKYCNLIHSKVIHNFKKFKKIEVDLLNDADLISHGTFDFKTKFNTINVHR